MTDRTMRAIVIIAAFLLGAMTYGVVDLARGECVCRVRCEESADPRTCYADPGTCGEAARVIRTRARSIPAVP